MSKRPRSSERLSDGRTVHAVQPVPTDPWSVWVDGDLAGAVTHRWLLRAVGEALREAADPAFPAWVVAVSRSLAGVETPLGMRFTCPCCDYLTLTQSGADKICPVCGWQDSVAQMRDPELGGGANRASLLQARASYAELGASEERRKPRCRAPLPEEIPDWWQPT